MALFFICIKMASNGNYIVCDSYDRTVEKTRLVRNVITEFTGNPPKDYQHIHGVKTVIENYPHPNVHSLPSSHTIPVGPGDVWEKMTDWDQLTAAEQNSNKDFLLERFAVDDLELAYDEFYPKYGKLPTVHDYRVFILNWEAQMKQDLETKDDNIHQLSNRESNLRLALDHTVMHSVNQQGQINNLLSDNESLHDENSVLTTQRNQLSNDVRDLRDDNRQLSSDNSNKDKTLAQQVRVNSYLRRDVSTRDATIEQRNTLCAELKTKTKQLCKTVDGLKTEVTDLKTEVTDLKTEVTDLKTENTDLKTENTDLKTEVTDLKTENTQKDSTISELQTDNTHLQTENTQKDSTISELQTDNTHLQTENTQKDSTISELQTENTQKDSKIKNLNSETKNLKKDNILLYQKLEETTEICEQKDRQLRIQKIKVDDLQYQMSETGDRIARLEKVNEDKCDEINRLIGNNDEQAEHIRSQNNTIDDLRHRLQEQESINRDLYSQIAELRQLVLAQIGAAEE
ncbi:paramyosin-like isoform X2 [Mytilus trossulus]|uniref:paramyosin-like isoform X2 n=1 Tax=Mytilus trossulus TaxID=6551 RepID=UPI003004A758